MWKRIPVSNVLIAGEVIIPVKAGKKSVFWMIAAILLFGFFLSLIAGNFLSYVFLEPVKTLEMAAGEIDRGNYNLKVELGESREFSLLEKAFNQMSHALRQKERLKTFVPRRLMEEVTGVRQRAATEGGEWIQAVVLSSDIRSFTTLTEKTPPEDLVEGINSYYEAMQEEIEKQRGMILKIIGDAIIAVFFQENGTTSHITRAVEGARGMARRLKVWNRQRISDGRFPITNGIGLANGELMACRLGITGGRLEFTVIGETMHQAAELEALSARSNETSIIVSENIASGMNKNEIIGPADAEARGWKIIE